MKAIKYNELMMKRRNEQLISIGGLTGLFISLIFLLSACGSARDLSDISREIGSSSVEFRSERGFGNDRFDVYSFSLKNPENRDDFRMMDEESRVLFADFTHMIDVELMDDQDKASSLIADINKIRNMEDGQYMYVNPKGVEKLYLYSPLLNRGYCLILVI